MTLKNDDFRKNDRGPSEILLNPVEDHHLIPFKESQLNPVVKPFTVGSLNTRDVETSPSTPSPNRDIGVHEESFHGFSPEDVMEGFVNITTMDYVSQLLKAQFFTTHGLYAPSFQYSSCLQTQGQTHSKIPKNVDCVQIHYCNAHYVVSSQKNRELFLYDSLFSNTRIQKVLNQMQLIYDIDDPQLIRYQVPQSQGHTSLCAMFATANALSILMGHSPSDQHYDTESMRVHLRDCLCDGYMKPFPSTGSSIPNTCSLPKTKATPCLINNTDESIKRYFDNQKHYQFLKNLTKEDTIDTRLENRKSQIRAAVKRKRLCPIYQNRQREKETSKRKLNRDVDVSSREKQRKRDALARKLKRKSDADFKADENHRETKMRKLKRITDSSYRDCERKRDVTARKLKRKSDADFMTNERQRETKMRKLKIITDSSYRDCERKRDVTARKLKRKSDADFMANERRRETKMKKLKRITDSSYRVCERKTDVTARKLKRKSDADFMANERQRETKMRKLKTITDSSYRDCERKRDVTARKLKRKSDADFMTNERHRETKMRKLKRITDSSYIDCERKRDVTARKLKRKSDADFMTNERHRETKMRKLKRITDSSYRDCERKRDVTARKLKRYDDFTFREKEKLRDRTARELLRKDKDFREKERLNRQNKQNKSSDNIESLIQHFHHSVSGGPTFICTCCGQLWYRHSVIHATTSKSDSAAKCQRNILSQDGKEWLCKSCHKHLKVGKIPPCAIENGLDFHDVPAVLKGLHSLELRLLAPRIPFMKIFQTPRGNQFKLLGNIVNVPCNVVQTVSTLPRLQNEDGTIPVNFKRRLSYKSSVFSENIRPQRVKEAAKWLTLNSSLYQRENIQFDENWTYTINRTSEETDYDSSDHRNRDHQTDKSETTHSDQEEDEIEDTEVHGGCTHTMLSAPNFIEEEEKYNIWSFAPGQHSHPISIFKDTYSEELSFPSIFCGEPRTKGERHTKVFYSDIVKSELRRYDRRVAKCVDNIFFKTKKLQMQQIFGKVQIAVRKYKSKTEDLRAGTLIQKDAVSQLIHLDEGYRVLRTLRGSPPYFEQAKKDLFAMLRFLGPATFFMSFSAAETRWTHLLKILSVTVNGKDLTEDEAKSLSWQQKCKLIQSDPVTTSRHFHYSVQQLLKFMHNTLNPLGGKLLDHFYRVEYQHRGSPHIHMLVWIEGAPKYEEDKEDSQKSVTEFIDRVVSCSSDHKHADLQTHSHSRTCKKGRKMCRFNYPQPPMKQTNILKPLCDSETSIQQKNYKVVKELLEQMKYGEDITFTNFLQKLKMTEDQYIQAIRSSITTATVFLKRLPKEIRVNPYIPCCLSAWQANMDAQYILDPYACAQYVVGYISKSQRGMSLLLDRACKEARDKSSNIREQVSIIGNKFTNNVEISAQEAVDICLQVPLRHSSRQVLFVATSPPSERTRFLKSMDDLMELDHNSTDVAMGNILSRYVERPKSLECISLADWAASYDKVQVHMRQQIIVMLLMSPLLMLQNSFSQMKKRPQENVKFPEFFDMFGITKRPTLKTSTENELCCSQTGEMKIILLQDANPLKNDTNNLN